MREVHMRRRSHGRAANHVAERPQGRHAWTTRWPMAALDQRAASRGRRRDDDGPFLGSHAPEPGCGSHRLSCRGEQRDWGGAQSRRGGHRVPRVWSDRMATAQMLRGSETLSRSRPQQLASDQTCFTIAGTSCLSEGAPTCCMAAKSSSRSNSSARSTPACPNAPRPHR